NASGPPAASVCGPRGAPSVPFADGSSGHTACAAVEKSSAGGGALHSSVPGDSFASSNVCETTAPVTADPLTSQTHHARCGAPSVTPSTTFETAPALPNSSRARSANQ